jgi:hypothetical protein
MVLAPATHNPSSRPIYVCWPIVRENKKTDNCYYLPPF